MRLRTAPAALLAALTVVSPVLAEPINLPGQVTYRERIALPEFATLQLQLIDQTLSAAPPRLAVEAPIGKGQVPLSFTLTFEDSLILPGHSYALIATISVEGGMLFRNFEPYPVDPLAPVEPVMIVANFVGRLDNGASSAEPPESGPLAILGATWTATIIAGDPAVPRSTASLQIGGDMRAGGRGGCNSWFAQVQVGDGTIRFGTITSTMATCFGDDARNAQEKAYYAALAAAVAWQVEGDQLTLFGADGKPLLVFTS